MKTSGVRERIIETASRLFYENGYNLTGINEIIKEAGIAKASLYAHFRSKEALCIAYLQRKDERFRHALRAYLLEKNSGPDRVLGLYDFLLTFYETPDFSGCWCLNTISEVPKDKTSIVEEIIAQKKAFQRMIVKLLEENVPGKDADSLGRQLYLLYEGAISEAYLLGDDWPIREARSTAAVLIQ